MTKFRPCIDLHNGKVKQIVGGTLSDDEASLKTNFTSEHPPSHYASMYKNDHLTGGHVIQLGPGNKDAALEALTSYPNGLQIGGGIHINNAQEFLNHGASHVILTSWLFSKEGEFIEDRIIELSQNISPNKIVIDLSCRSKGNSWIVAMNRWQTPTNLEISNTTLDSLAKYCDEFLIHAADVEGKCEGIDENLVAFLGNWGKIPITYAGGAHCFNDLDKVASLSSGNVDLTIGSALDIFGGSQILYADCVAYNHSS